MAKRPPATVGSRELGELMIMHAANIVEQACKRHGEPAPCLALATEHVKAATRAAAVPTLPPVTRARGGARSSGDTELSVSSGAVTRRRAARPVAACRCARGEASNPSRRCRQAVLLPRFEVRRRVACGTSASDSTRWRQIAELTRLRRRRRRDREKLDTIAFRHARTAMLARRVDRRLRCGQNPLDSLRGPHPARRRQTKPFAGPRRKSAPPAALRAVHLPGCGGTPSGLGFSSTRDVASSRGTTRATFPSSAISSASLPRLRARRRHSMPPRGRTKPRTSAARGVGAFSFCSRWVADAKTTSRDVRRS